jgi:hypothetical protein
VKRRLPALLAALLAGAILSLTLAQLAVAQAPLRGLGGAASVFPTSSDNPVGWDTLARELHPQVIRVDLEWHFLEPQRGVYDDAYIARLATAIDTIRASGAKVLLHISVVPRWASDSAFWKHPMPGDRANVYRGFYPVRRDRLADLRACMQHLSTALQGKVLGYVCWNEPNLWGYIYPQRTVADSAFSAHLYGRMLEAFFKGVRAGDPLAKVVAGETAPAGRNDRLSTSPQRFAQILKRGGIARWFDVYSHHPYSVGGTKHIAPEDPPSDPSHTVSLGNLRTLLRIFPGKPFYLTEWAYSTRFSFHFGIATTETGQATYLRRGYRLVAHYSQVRMLLWWMLRDSSKIGSYRDQWGWYMGLRRLDNIRKPAYYAFAGGNRLALDQPAAISRGSAATLRGTLTSASMGGLGGKVLRVKRLTGSGWITVLKVRTGDGGAYAVRVRPKATATWRVVWPGVATSARQRLVVK